MTAASQSLFESLREALRNKSNPLKAATLRTFFKHCKEDVFLGVGAKEIRAIAKQNLFLPLEDLRRFMFSDVHDERSLAHAILRLRFEKSQECDRERLYHFYLENRGAIRDWDGVDDSAPYIVGRYLLDKKERGVLYELAASSSVWDRRIAIVSTWWFIRNGQFQDSLNIAAKLLFDQEDLIHKAVGWMLREIGKKNEGVLLEFLTKHHREMPRTMLRYAIEKFSEERRMTYLKR